MIICPACQNDPNKINWAATMVVPRRKPVFNWQLCASRLLRCVNRPAHLKRLSNDITALKDAIA